MKKILSLLLVMSMCLSIIALFTACDKPTEEKTSSVTESGDKWNEWLLPTKIVVPSEEFNITLNWTENRCTFEAEDTTWSFVYDESKRSLGVYIDGGTDYAYENLCVFDEQDRITAINFQDRSVLQLSYVDEKMTVSAYGEGELNAPKEINADWENRKVQMPPFDDPNDFLYFTEWGDLYAGEETTLYDFKYDAKGNILSILMSDIGGYTWNIEYADSPMTKSWQRTVLKLMLPFVLGRPMNVFAMDMMCFGLYQHHSGA